LIDLFTVRAAPKLPEFDVTDAGDTQIIPEKVRLIWGYFM